MVLTIFRLGHFFILGFWSNQGTAKLEEGALARSSKAGSLETDRQAKHRAGRTAGVIRTRVRPPGRSRRRDRQGRWLRQLLRARPGRPPSEPKRRESGRSDSENSASAPPAPSTVPPTPTPRPPPPSPASHSAPAR